VKAGKIRFIGCSNLSLAELDDAMAVSRQNGLAAFVTSQDEYSLLDRSVEKAQVPALRRHGLGLLPYFPLASGLLTGKYKMNASPPQGSRLAGDAGRSNNILNDHNLRIVEALSEFAAKRGHTILELAMSWLASRPFVPSIIAGATKPEQVEQNIAAVGWVLSPADLAEIDRITL
jgi:aryl-alcohol dehydrogenase-like predicted oxidoreductase